MGFVFLMFAISDYYYYGEGEGFYVTLRLRGVGLIFAITASFTAGIFKRYKNTLIMITLVELALFMIYLLNLYILKATHPSLQFMSVMLFILAVFLIPNVWKNCLIAGIVIWASYILYSAILGNPGESPTVTQRAIYLGICLLSCAIFLYGRENSRRKQYIAEKLLEFITITDRLTGIYNRSRFEYTLGLWIRNMRHDPFCLILFDIDDFKKINDTFGHSAGDQVLMGTSEIVTANIRDSDFFARWGGEEFVILFGNTGIDHAKEFAERIRKAVETNNRGPAGKVTISLGVVQYHRPETILEFVNRADANMYEAKQDGKNRVVAENP